MQPQSFPVTDAFRGMRLDRFLQAMLPRMSRSSIQEAIDGRVTLASGLAPRPARRLAVGDVVTIEPRTARSGGAVAPDIATLAEGDGWLVVDKPAGIATTPTARRPGEDVASLLGLAPAHRLDRFTSGCLLLTRTPEAARHFDIEFRAHRVEKEYVAVVEGEPSRDVFEIDAPLARDVSSRVPGRMVVVAHGEGAPALTRIDVIACLGDRALVRARPLTGRRHQIRIHLAHAGHPIIGDLLYGGDERRFVRFQLGQDVETPEGLAPGRHLLHARRMAFREPGGEARDVVAAWPADFPRAHGDPS